MTIHWTQDGPVYLEEWLVTWTFLAGDKRRTFELVIPAASEEAAFDAAYAMADAIGEASNGVWSFVEEATAEREGES